MAPHITPFPERPDSLRDHDEHDVATHALQGMAGLVLGIHSVERAHAAADAATAAAPTRHLRLFAQQAPAVSDRLMRPSGYVLARDREPRPDSVSVPGPPLLLTRGETTAITVINRTGELTTVHWHGMELESIYDGVAGWSGAGSNLAPLIAPGDSFTVTFTPPRAGTFIYHTHMDEGMQLATGAYGPLLVLEPGERFEPATDIELMLGRAVDAGANRHALNGRSEPPPIDVTVGTTYRLRIISMLPAAPVAVDLRTADGLLEWRPLAKDGALLPAALRRSGPAAIDGMGVGETYDFLWTPARPLDAVLTLQNSADEFAVRQTFRVR
jgi:FtsP/CotA-like multicopper oxidase with cupredoxin domain